VVGGWVVVVVVVVGGDVVTAVEPAHPEINSSTAAKRVGRGVACHLLTAAAAGSEFASFLT